MTTPIPELKELMAKATKLPKLPIRVKSMFYAGYLRLGIRDMRECSQLEAYRIAQLVEAAVNSIPGLLAESEAWKAANADLRKEVSEIVNYRIAWVELFGGKSHTEVKAMLAENERMRSALEKIVGSEPNLMEGGGIGYIQQSEDGQEAVNYQDPLALIGYIMQLAKDALASGEDGGK
jgi:hypothetical protein